MPSSAVSIIGSGNMAESLLRVFTEKGVTVSGIWSRNQDRLQVLFNQFGVKVYADIKEIDKDSIVLLCLSDDAIAEVSSQLDQDLFVCHTSGSVSMDAISQSKRGVFYPLQTMTKGRKIFFSEVPVLLESNGEVELHQLKKLGEKISNNVKEVDSAKRKEIHLAAVILNNFVTQLVKMSGDHLEKQGLDASVLNPLLKETVEKIKDIGAEKALTGPAKRGDEKVIASHLESLDGDLQELYALVSKIIQKENGKL